MNQQSHKIAIVIVTYNATRYLPRLLDHVADYTYPADLIKVIIVDNNSTDDTLAQISSHRIPSEIITNSENVGFAAANNQGYEVARKWGADYLFLLNQDALLNPDVLSILVEYLSSHLHTAAVQPKILMNDGKTVNSYGTSVHFLGFGYLNYNRQPDEERFNQVLSAPFLSGAACLISMAALEKTGLFNAEYFMYHEDVELGWRLRSCGYELAIVPQAVAQHDFHDVSAGGSGKYQDRNRLITLLIQYRLATLLIILPALALVECIFLIKALVSGKVSAYFFRWSWIFIHAKLIAKWRRSAQSSRTVSDRVLLSQMTGVLTYQKKLSPVWQYMLNPLLSGYLWLLKIIIVW